MAGADFVVVSDYLIGVIVGQLDQLSCQIKWTPELAADSSSVLADDHPLSSLLLLMPVIIGGRKRIT